MQTYDLIIAGAGPAGLTLAWKTAEQGHSVLVIDKKANASDVAYLTAGSNIDFEERDLPKKIGHPLKKVYFSSKNEHFFKNGDAFMINRRTLLEILEKKAKKHGVEIKYNSVINDVNCTRNEINKIKYSAKKEEFSAKARFYADCSGIGRAFEKHLNILGNHKIEHALGIEYVLPIKSEPNTLDLYVGTHYAGGYGWLCPLNKKQAIMGYGTFKRENFSSIKSFLDGMFQFPRVNERIKNEPIELNSGLLRTGAPLKNFTKGNLVLVGDIALQSNPLLGEGVRFVMDSARMASFGIDKAIKKGNNELEIYNVLWRKKYYNLYSVCYRMQKVLRKFSNNDKIMDLSVKSASKFPDRIIQNMLWVKSFDKAFLKNAFKEVIWMSLKASSK